MLGINISAIILSGSLIIHRGLIAFLKGVLAIDKIIYLKYNIRVIKGQSFHYHPRKKGNLNL